MKQYIDKAAVVAEIERRKEDALQKKGQCKRSGLERIMHQIGAYNKILSFLDTLEVNNDFKPLDSDFERDAVSFCIDRGLNTTPYIAKTIAKHFFELGLKAKGE